MRKFWKLGLIVGVVAFMAGCSNLWDYVPPPRVDNAPVSSDGASGGGGGGGGGKPSGGGGGSGPTLNVLTFYVNDGSGEAKPVTVTPTGNSKTASLIDIQNAFQTRYPNSKPPAGFTATGASWLDSGMKTPGANISGGSTLVINYPPDSSSTTNVYTVTLSTGSEGGNRKFPTITKDGSTKTLKEVLVAAGVADSNDSDAKPKNTPTGWDFIQWVKPGSSNPSDPSNKVDPSTLFNSGDNIVAVYHVTYKIKINGTDYPPIKVPVTAPNEGATWAEILAAAENDSTITAAAGGGATQLDKMLWKVGSSVADDNKRYPANTTFIGTAKGPEPTTPISYTIKDAVGKEMTVKVDVPQSQASTGATLQDIIDEAKKQPGTNFGNADITIDSWTKDGGANTVGTSEKIAPSATIQPKERTAKYYVTKDKAKANKQTVPFTLNIGDTGKDWSTVLSKSTGDTEGGFMGLWTAKQPDGDFGEAKITDSKIYVPGTAFEARYFEPKLPNASDWKDSEKDTKFDKHKLPTTQWALKTPNGEYVYVIFEDDYVTGADYMIYLHYGYSTVSLEDATRKALGSKKAGVYGDRPDGSQLGCALFEGFDTILYPGLSLSSGEAYVGTFDDLYNWHRDESGNMVPNDPSLIYGKYNINRDGDLIHSDGNLLMGLQDIYYYYDGDEMKASPRPQYYKLQYDLTKFAIVDGGKYVAGRDGVVTCVEALSYASPNFHETSIENPLPYVTSRIQGTPIDLPSSASTAGYTFVGWISEKDIPKIDESLTVISGTKYTLNENTTLVAVFQKQ